MMSAEFSEFADAMARPKKAVVTGARGFDRVAVLGGGADARLLAAMCLSENAQVTLFSAYGSELDAMRAGGGISLRGEGPVGSYQINSDAAPSIRVTAELDRAVSDAELIFLTGPVHKQRTYAMVLADHLADGQVLMLTSGRTLGALETRALLKSGGCASDITVVEAPSLPFWYSVEGSTLHLSHASCGGAATLPANRFDVQSGLARFFSQSTAHINTLHSSFGDGSGLVEVPALLLGGPAVAAGGPVVAMGGKPLEENDTFRNLIGDEHHGAITALAEERRAVARSFGVRDLPDDETWLDRHAGASSGSAARPVPSRTEAHAILRDAVIGSLAPLASAGAVAAVATPNTNAMITLASSLLGADLGAVGRSLPAVGVTANNADDARRQLEQLAGDA